MRQREKILAALAISTYLVAALVPCEPTIDVRDMDERVAAASGIPKTQAAHNHGSHAPDSHDDHAGDSQHAQHSSSGSGSGSTTTLAFTAPCLCGCGDTRSTIGGGAARLGAALPSEERVDVTTVDRPRAAAALVGAFPRRALPIDPIPI